MSEEQAEYLTDAMQMIGAGYSIEIEQARTVISRRAGKMVSEDRPAFVKVSTSFKQELPNISGDALKVFLFIALSINRNTGRANPGLRTIAAGVGMAINTLQKVLKELEDLQLLTVDRESRRYNIYETPEYISANKAEPTVSSFDTDHQSVSNQAQSVSNSDQTVSSTRGKNLLNQSNQREPDILDAVLEFAKIDHVRHNAYISFESALGFGKLPWDDRPEWRRLGKFVRHIFSQDELAFKRYSVWRKGEGKYQAMSNSKIRQHPDMFIDTGWPTFLAHSAMNSPEEKTRLL